MNSPSSCAVRMRFTALEGGWDNRLLRRVGLLLLDSAAELFEGLPEMVGLLASLAIAVMVCCKQGVPVTDALLLQSPCCPC